MATGGVDITEYITCGVCREVYRDPYALQCLHTFCKGCIDGMEIHRMLKCPLCQEVFPIGTIRKDFKTQAMIDSHRQTTTKSGLVQRMKDFLTYIAAPFYGKDDLDRSTESEVSGADRFAMDKGQDFSRLATSTYRRVGRIHLRNWILRMRMICGKLYCAIGEDGIEVYDTNLKFIKNITSPKLGYVTSVAQCDRTGDLIVACGGCDHQNKGVHQLTPEGNYVTCIKSDNEFADVCSQHGRVYALNYSEQKIQVFEKSSKKKIWNEAEEKQIRIWIRGHDKDKMVIRGDRVLVSSMDSGLVLLYYASNRAFQRSLGSRGKSKEPGMLKHPAVCDIDDEGHLVVCDSTKQSVQVCHVRNDVEDEDRWHCVTLPGFQGGPYNAVVATDARTLWVATSGEIIKYEV